MGFSVFVLTNTGNILCQILFYFLPHFILEHLFLFNATQRLPKQCLTLICLCKCYAFKHPWFANSPASASTLAFLVHSISTLPPFLFPAFPVTVDTTIYLLSQQPFKDTDFFIFLFPVSDACVLLIAYCSLCHFPCCSGLSLEILLAFLLLVNIVLISKYLVPALYTPLTLGVSLFPFFFFPLFLSIST